MQRLPRTRSEKLRSQATGESPISADLSLDTSVDPMSVDSQATLKKATPQRHVGEGGAPARLAGNHTTEGGVIPVCSARDDTVPTDTCTIVGNPAQTVVSRIANENEHGQALRRINEKDRHSVRSSKRRAEAQARLIVAKRELEIAEARSKMALAELEMLQIDSDEDMELEEHIDRSHHVEEWLNQTNRQPIEERVHSDGNRNDIQELAVAISKLTDRNLGTIASKHMVELPQFNGASEEWLAFKRSFEDTSQIFTHAQNLARLRRALQGRAREAVKSLLFTAEDPYVVLKGLEARFGRPGALALAELEKLKNLSRITENPNEVCVFASRVKNAVATIKALGKPQYLSSPETMKVIIEKMPSTMKYRWFAYHRSHRDEEQQELVLIDNFLEIESDMCGDFASLEVLPEAKKSRQRYAPPEVSWEQNSEPRRADYIAQDNEEPYSRYNQTCPECQAEHWIYECRKFKEADIDARWEIAKRAKICFKCLRFRHTRLSCDAPTCKKCFRWHHVTLHSDRPQLSVEDKSRCNAVMTNDGDCEEYGYEKTSEPSRRINSVHTTATEGQAYLKMLPVNLYGPKGSTQVLALLDEGSTTTLLDSSIAKQIGAEGDEEPLTIETVGGQSIRKSNSQRVQLKIKGAHRKDKKAIEIRTIDNLKLSKQGVRKEDVDRCEHLKAIQDQLIYERGEPQLLIGQDNWNLTITRRLKKGNLSDPVASLTSLGWVFHGSVNRTPVHVVNHSRQSNARELWVRPQQRSAGQKKLSLLRKSADEIMQDRHDYTHPRHSNNLQKKTVEIGKSNVASRNEKCKAQKRVRKKRYEEIPSRRVRTGERKTTCARTINDQDRQGITTSNNMSSRIGTEGIHRTRWKS